VLNVLVAVGIFVALSGWLLRNRARTEKPPASQALSQELMAAALIVAVISYATRRILTQRMAGARTTPTESLFFWSHVVPALIAAIAAPLGLMYGWWVEPSVGSVVPFWVVALALGSLALPRASELECFGQRDSGSGRTPS
jgi:hypothetical protein